MCECNDSEWSIGAVIVQLVVKELQAVQHSIVALPGDCIVYQISPALLCSWTMRSCMYTMLNILVR